MISSNSGRQINFVTLPYLYLFIQNFANKQKFEINNGGDIFTSHLNGNSYKYRHIYVQNWLLILLLSMFHLSMWQNRINRTSCGLIFDQLIGNLDRIELFTFCLLQFSVTYVMQIHIVFQYFDICISFMNKQSSTK